MSAMVIENPDALRGAGADEDKARKAAQAMTRDERFGKTGKRFDRLDRRFEPSDPRMARVETRLDLLSWMVGIVLALAGGAFTGTMLLFPRAFPQAVGG